LGVVPEAVVDADLDDVHLLICDAGSSLRACFVWRVGASTGPARNAGVVERRCRLRRSALRIPTAGLATEAEDGRDAIRGVCAKIWPARLDVSGVQLMMPGMTSLAVERNACGAGGNLHRARGTGRDNAPVAHEE
jgi:hypothetical protein